MPRMYLAATIMAVQRELAIGGNQRDIARRLHIGRGTVVAVSTGRRKPSDKSGQERPYVKHREFAPKRVKPYVCEGCGYEVCWRPCVVCEAKKGRGRGDS